MNTPAFLKAINFRSFAAFALLILLSSCSSLESIDCCANTVPATQLTGNSAKVMTLNIAHGRDDSFNQLFVSKKRFKRNLDDIARLLLEIEPDVVALQEADGPSRWSGNFNHVQYLLSQTGWINHIHKLHADGWLSKFGTAIITPHELSDTHSQDFKKSFPSTTKGFVSATINLQHQDATIPLTVLSVHLDFLRRSVRQNQINELSAYVQQIDGPVIIAGDFNGEWKNDKSAVRELIQRLHLKAFEPEAEGMGTYKKLAGKRLDWILISENLEFLSYDTYEDIVSDHLAVVADIKYIPVQ